MVNIIIATHGDFGVELIKSAEMIIGKMSGVYPISLREDMSIDDFISKGDEVMRNLNGDILCLVDLFAGTPSTGLTALSVKYNNEVVTGLNLAMLIEVYTNKELEISKLAKLALETLNQSGRNVTKELKGN